MVKIDSNNLTILFVLSGKGISGAEYVLFDFLERLSCSYNYQYIFFIQEPNAELKIEISKKFPDKIIIMGDYKIPFNRITRWVTAKIDFCYFKKKFLGSVAWKKLSDKKIDLVYLNNSIETISFPFEMLNVPVVAHLHDMLDALPPAIRKLLVNRLKKTNHVICVSKAVENSIKKYIKNPLNISVIYNGLFDKEEPRLFIRDFSRMSEIKIGFVGSIIKRKGPDILISACKYLNKMLNKRIIVEFIFNDYDPKIIKRLLNEKNKNKNIEYKLIGKLDRSCLLKEYEKIDIIAVPSRRDPLPNVILEALSMGKIVLGARTDGIPEMIIEDIFLFNREDPADLARCINNILTLPREKLIEKMDQCINYCRKNFSLTEKVIKINNVIENSIFKKNQ